MRHLGARNRVSPKLDRLGSREWQLPWSHGAASEVKFPALQCGLLASRAWCWCSALPGGLPPKEAPRNSKGAGVFGAALTGEVQPGGGGRQFGLVSLHVAG